MLQKEPDEIRWVIVWGFGCLGQWKAPNFLGLGIIKPFWKKDLKT